MTIIHIHKTRRGCQLGIDLLTPPTDGEMEELRTMFQRLLDQDALRAVQVENARLRERLASFERLVAPVAEFAAHAERVC